MIALHAVLAAGVHHGRRTDDVRLQEDAGILDGAVDMALGGEVHHDVGVLLGEELVHALAVADVNLDEAEVGVIAAIKKITFGRTRFFRRFRRFRL